MNEVMNRTQANIVTSTLEMCREEWLQYRKEGIGGSDAATVLGQNKWKSPIMLFLEKTDQIESEDIQSEPAYWGNRLEAVVAEEFEKRVQADLGIELQVEEYPYLLQHPEYPFMLANVDRLIVGQNVGLECKTAHEYLKGEWEDEEIPAAYLLQCQHYMAVSGFEGWWIAVLVGGNKFRYKYIERDDELIQMIIEGEKDFWENHVLERVTPPFDGSDATAEFLKKHFAEAEEDSEIELPDSADALMEEFLLAKQAEKQAKEHVKLIENKLKGLLQEKEKGTGGSYFCTWKNSSRTTFDSERFESEHPELYLQYIKKSPSRRFHVGQIKTKKLKREA